MQRNVWHIGYRRPTYDLSMNYKEICYSIKEAIATIELHRPENSNAYTPDMGEELVHAFRCAIADTAVRVVIISGAGKNFCVGADREYLAGKTGRCGLRLGEEQFINSFPIELNNSVKPLIAAIGGAAVGIGVTMVLSFDLRIAAEDAVFGFPFTRLGMVPGLGSTHLLHQLVGRTKANEIVLCAAKVNAQEALTIGLVNKVVPREQLMAEARAMAQCIIKSPAHTIAAAKRALNFGITASFEAAFANEQLENKSWVVKDV